MSNMTYSDQGLALTKAFEGLELTAYQDQGGVWTIGYGHTGHVWKGMTITEAQADRLLMDDLDHPIAAVNRLVKVDMTQGQFDALVDFAFNLGSGQLATSALLRELNAGDKLGAAAELTHWDHVKGIDVPGLLRRRQAEMRMFLGVPQKAAA